MSGATGLKRTARRGASRFVKSAAAAVDVARTPARGITILIYHRVGAGIGGEMDLAPAAFERQLDDLRHHRVLTLDEAADELAGDAPVRPGVVLTFDDGSADWCDVVLPILDRRAIPATWYVASGFIEAGRLPDGAPAASWARLREAAAHPLITLGSHTHRHLLLDRLAPAEIGEELDHADALIEERTGVRARHFAYPKAVPPSAAAAREVGARYRTAVLAGTRANVGGADLLRLARSPIQASDGPKDFARKVAGGLGAEDALRQRLNRMRYRGRSD